MRKTVLILVVYALCLSAPGARADVPELEEGVLVKDVMPQVNKAHTAAPEVVDWNNDGKKDLLVGQFDGGKVLLFINKGTDELPSFDKGTYLKSGDEEIKVGSS